MERPRFAFSGNGHFGLEGVTPDSERAGLHVRSGSAVPGIGLQPEPFAAGSENEPAAGNSRAGRTPAIGMIDGCRLILHSDGEKKRHFALQKNAQPGRESSSAARITSAGIRRPCIFTETLPTY